MIGFFTSATQVPEWAAQRAEQLFADFIETGSLLSLGYAMAMEDVAHSVIDPDADIPAYQADMVISESNRVAPVELLRAA
jgi:hypothetical protein